MVIMAMRQQFCFLNLSYSLFLNYPLNILSKFLSIFSWFLVYYPSRFWILIFNFLSTSFLSLYIFSGSPISEILLINLITRLSLISLYFTSLSHFYPPFLFTSFLSSYIFSGSPFSEILLTNLIYRLSVISLYSSSLSQFYPPFYSLLFSLHIHLVVPQLVKFYW
jgi:hypothetical protein